MQNDGLRVGDHRELGAAFAVQSVVKPAAVRRSPAPGKRSAGAGEAGLDSSREHLRTRRKEWQQLEVPDL